MAYWFWVCVLFDCGELLGVTVIVFGFLVVGLFACVCLLLVDAVDFV